MKGGTDGLGNVFCAHAPAARCTGFIPSPGLDYGSNKFCLAVLGWACGRRGALGAGRVR
jgi:hypothetical protein